MTKKVKCAKCSDTFETSDEASTTCPLCKSDNIFSLSGSALKIGLIGVGVFLGVAVILFFMLSRGTDGGSLPEIIGVDVDSIQRTISISAVSKSTLSLKYSIDNNKSGASESSDFANVPAGKYYVCVIYGDGAEDRVMWKNNPVIMPESNSPTVSTQPQIIGVDIISPDENNLGKIIIHAQSSYPIEYVLNDSARQIDSVFNNVIPGWYKVSIVDSRGGSDRYIDPVLIPGVAIRETDSDSNTGTDEEDLSGGDTRTPESQPCNQPDPGLLQAQINQLFNEHRGDKKLHDDILSQFNTQRVIVNGSLLNTTEDYTIYQYLYRQNIGLPGSIKIRLGDIKTNKKCKITYIEISEYSDN